MFKSLRSVLMVAVLVGAAAFVYGLVVARYEIFPYAYIYRVYKWISHDPDEESLRQIRALHLVLNERVVEPGSPLVGRGGGIARFEDVVVGADAAGQFFYFDGDRIRMLDIQANLNRGAAFEYIDRHGDEKSRRRAFEAFRVFDLEIRESGNSTELYLTHPYWDSEQVVMRVRLSRLLVQDFPGVLTQSRKYTPGDWEVLYECEPAIEFSQIDPSPFISDHSGGRIALGPDGGIYVSFGDRRFDGVAHPLVASQEDNTCFGKIFRVDPDSLAAQEIARGLRNTQGLTFDLQGRLWSSDHGPHAALLS